MRLQTGGAVLKAGWNDWAHPRGFHGRWVHVVGHSDEPRGGGGKEQHFVIASPMRGEWLELHRANCQSFTRQLQRGEINNHWDASASSPQEAVRNEIEDFKSQGMDTHESDIKVHACAKRPEHAAKAPRGMTDKQKDALRKKAERAQKLLDKAAKVVGDRNIDVNTATYSDIYDLHFAERPKVQQTVIDHLIDEWHRAHPGERGKPFDEDPRDIIARARQEGVI